MRQILGVVLLVASRLVSATDPAAFPLKAVEARLRGEASAGELALLSAASCASPVLPAQMAPTEFDAKYPHGLYIVCDARVSEATAHATILRYLFNASRNQVLAASTIEATLSKRGSSWRVQAWRKTAVGYAP